ncbi:MAG: hypothetical protein WC833_08705 [Bacteroidales bacterium]|jgi:hypothetical protein
MKTIFDFNPTPEELDYFSNDLPHDKWYEHATAGAIYNDIAFLFHIRGDIKTAKKYEELRDKEPFLKDECL